jgi:hypothetical protein
MRNQIKNWMLTSSVADPNLHNFVKPDKDPKPDPHKNEKLNLEPDPDTHQIKGYELDPHPVLRIRSRPYCFGLPDPDPLVRSTVPYVPESEKTSQKNQLLSLGNSDVIDEIK